MINSFNRFNECTNQFADWNRATPNMRCWIPRCGYPLFRSKLSKARGLIFRIENYNNDNPMDC